MNPATLHPGVLKAFNSGTYLARVTLTGSLMLSLDNVPVNRGIPAAQMVAGRKVAVVLFGDTKADDALVLAVYT